MPSSACKKCALRSEEHTSDLQSHSHLVCRLLLEQKIAEIGGGKTGTTDQEHAVGPQPHDVVVRGVSSSAIGDGVALGPRRQSAVAFCFFNDRGTTEIATLPLPAALPF